MLWLALIRNPEGSEKDVDDDDKGSHDGDDPVELDALLWNGPKSSLSCPDISALACHAPECHRQ